MSRILVPMDFGPASRRALTHALFLARKLGAQVDVLHVWEPSPYVSPTSLVWLHGEQRSFWDHMQRDLKKRLAEVVDEVRGPDDPDVNIIVEAGYTSYSILHALENGHHDLVVMGTHGRRWISRLLLGSIAARIIRLAPCPVLTVRARQDEAADAVEEPSGLAFESPHPA